MNSTFTGMKTLYKDGGVSINGNKILCQNLKTPILVGEHI